MNINKYYLFVSLFFSISWGYAQTVKVIEGLLLGEEGEPIPYATILSVDPAIYGGVSNIAGEFKIQVHSSDSVLQFFISSLGYKDTIVTLSIDKNPNRIKLLNEIILMDEVQIDAKKMNEDSLGSHNYLFPATADSSLAKMGSSIIGSSVGNMYKITDKDKILKSASFYIDNHSKKEKTYLISFYESFGKYKYFQLYNRTGLTKKNKKNILITVKEPGWYDVQLLDYGIILKENSNFFVSITDVSPIKNINDFGGETIDLVMQQNNDRRTYQFVVMGNKFAIIKSKDLKFAIVLYLLSD